MIMTPQDINCDKENMVGGGADQNDENVPKERTKSSKGISQLAIKTDDELQPEPIRSRYRLNEFGDGMSWLCRMAKTQTPRLRQIKRLAGHEN